MNNFVGREDMKLGESAMHEVYAREESNKYAKHSHKKLFIVEM